MLLSCCRFETRWRSLACCSAFTLVKGTFTAPMAPLRGIEEHLCVLRFRRRFFVADFCGTHLPHFCCAAMQTDQPNSEAAAKAVRPAFCLYS